MILFYKGLVNIKTFIKTEKKTLIKKKKTEKKTFKNRKKDLDKVLLASMWTGLV